MVNKDADNASVSDIRSVARVADICALFGVHADELTAAEVAERTGLNRTTAYRYCASMTAAGILERGSRRGAFALGPMMLEIGLQALGKERVVELAGPHLRRLSAATEMTAVLSIPGAHGPVVALVAEESSSPVLVTVRVGTNLDATAAQSQVFLAYDHEPTTQVLTSELSAAQRTRLMAEVAGVRREGYSVVRPPSLPFVVAAPIFDGQKICATVAVLGVGDIDLAPVIEELLATAEALNQALGSLREVPRSADL